MHNISLWAELLNKKEKDREKLRKETLKSILPILKRFFLTKKVKEVYLFGSILEVGMYQRGSDIDIGVLGLKEPYFSLLSELEDLLNKKVDLVEMEKCRFSAKIKEMGIRIK